MSQTWDGTRVRVTFEKEYHCFVIVLIVVSQSNVLVQNDIELQRYDHYKIFILTFIQLFILNFLKDLKRMADVLKPCSYVYGLNFL